MRLPKFLFFHQSVLIMKALEILERYLFQSEYCVCLDNEVLQETKVYNLLYAEEIIKESYHIYVLFALLMNEILLLPKEVSLQQRALQIVRRFYYLFPKMRSNLYKPISVLLSNISLFTVSTLIQESVQEQKEACIFLYKLMNDEKSEKELKDILEENENLQFLKENKKYFSVKALSYPNDINFIYNIRNLNLNIGFPLHIEIEAQGYHCVNLIVKLFNSDYDIGFGLFKLNTVKEIPPKMIDEEISNKKMETIIKATRLDSNKRTCIGSTLLNSEGYYRIYFDNSYSMFRNKSLYLDVHLLECKKKSKK